MGGYPAFHGHPWHHYFAVGPTSLLDLMVLPLLLVLLTTACWAGRRTAALLSRRKPSSASRQAGTGSTEAVQPVLASDAEREETARLVSHAVGEGRLSIEEGGQRIDAVLRARHRHELASLVSDLPPIAPAPSVQPFTSTRLRLLLLAVAAVVVLAAVLVQASAGLWELWPLAVVALGASTMLRHR